MKINTGWTTKTLGEILKDIGDGGTPNTNKKEYFGGDIPWVVIQDIKKEITDTKTTLTEQGLKSCSAKLWPTGTVILSTGATIGEVGIAQKPLATKQGIHGLVCNNEVESNFLFYKIQTLCDYLRANAQGSTIREVRAPFLKTIAINFPTDKPEQSKIVEILSTVDRAIEQTEALIAKQQRIKTGLMQDLLTRGIDAHGNLRSEETHEFKDSPLGRIPAEWECKELGECAYITKLAGFEFTSYFDYKTGGDMIALRALNIKHERLDLTDIQRIPRDVSDMLPRSKIYADDILITYIGAYIGDVLRIEENDKYHLAPNIAKIVSGKSLLPQYLEVFLRSNGVQRQIRNLTAITATPSLTMTQIRKLFIAFSKDTEEQERIALRIHAVSNAINSASSELVKLRSLKIALMQDLLTGRVRVTPLLEKTEPDS